MRHIRNIFLLFLFTFLFSCSDNFLDVEPQLNLSPEQAFSNYEDATVALMGVYDAFQSTSAYYGRNLIVTADIAGEDVIVAPQNSGRFLEQFNYTINPSSGFSAGFWNRAYNAINRANNIIAQIDLVDDAPEEDINDLLGQALALRALAHFDLLRVYARPYSWDNGESLGVPFMEEPLVSSPERDTVSVVYNRIVEDLTEAADLMRPSTSLDQRAYMSEYAAKALLARVYLYMERWQDAADLAIEVIEDGGYELVENDGSEDEGTNPYLLMWYEEFNAESIFSLAMSQIDYSSTDALGYIYLKEGYGDLRPNPEFVAMLDELGGIRRQAFLQLDLIEQEEFINKFPGRDNFPGLDNVPVLRLSEMYLIAAEALANLDQDEEAQTYLNAIVLRADPGASEISLTGDELKQRIYTEKRIEFAFEGHRMFDISRRQENLDRGEDCTSLVCFVPARDFRFVYPIPQRELDANPNMVQNSGYEQ